MQGSVARTGYNDAFTTTLNISTDSIQETQASSAISVVHPYFPSLTAYPAPYDEKPASRRLSR